MLVKIGDNEFIDTDAITRITYEREPQEIGPEDPASPFDVGNPKHTLTVQMAIGPDVVISEAETIQALFIAFGENADKAKKLPPSSRPGRETPGPDNRRVGDADPG